MAYGGGSVKLAGMKERALQTAIGRGLDVSQPYTITTGRGGGAGGDISGEYTAAKRANELRYAQMMDIYDKIIARAQPGGAFEKAGLGEIERAKTKGVGQEMQQMISSGMYGTTTAAGIGRGWEADVGAPARLRLEDIMEQRRTTAQLGKAGAIERREDVYPDVGAAAGYVAQATAAKPVPTTQRIVKKTPSPWEKGFMGGGWTL